MQEDVRERIKELVLEIVLAELKNYQAKDDDSEKQKAADSIAKIASILKKIERPGEDEEEAEDLAQLLSQLKKGRSAVRELHDEISEAREKLLAAHALVVELETLGRLDYEILGEIRRILEYLIVRVYAA